MKNGPKPDSIREAVFLSVGEASMCWSETPGGTFDAERAQRVGDELCDFIETKLRHLVDRPGVLIRGPESLEIPPRGGQ